MYGTEQTDSARPAHHLSLDSWTQRCRVITMKHALPMDIIKVMPSYHARGKREPRAAVQESARIQGGNWKMQGSRRSGNVHDEGECQLSIAEYMAEHGQFRDSDDA